MKRVGRKAMILCIFLGLLVAAGCTAPTNQKQGDNSTDKSKFRNEADRKVEEYLRGVREQDFQLMIGVMSDEQRNYYAEERAKGLDGFFQKGKISFDFAGEGHTGDSSGQSLFKYKIYNDVGRTKTVTVSSSESQTFVVGDIFLTYSFFAQNQIESFVQALTTKDAEELAAALSEDDLNYPLTEAQKEWELQVRRQNHQVGAIGGENLASLPNKENKAKYVQDTFNSIAGSYDLMNTIMTAGLDKKWRRLTVKLSEIRGGGKGLDVCCGTGMLTMELAQAAGPAGELVGLDFSENMLAGARKNIEDFNFRDTITFIQGDAAKLPFENSRFDCATVGWGLRNVPDTLTAVKEMLRVVRPGGKVVSLDMAQPTLPVFRQIYWFFFQSVVPAIGKVFSGNKKAYDYLHDSAKAFLNQQALANLFTEAGLVEVRYHNLLGGVVAVVEGRKPNG